jgi:hypothetical protein
MRVQILESNLMWSVRLASGVRLAGHEVVSDEPDAAIVNLGEPASRDQVATLRAAGVHVIAHAGHKELELHELGRNLGCDQLVTNRELTVRLGDIIARAKSV